ncbi:MAG: alanine:cation symporter family protein [Oscillospiraceae bacterium]
MADVLNGLMALPNLVALLLLSPEVLRLFKAFLEKEKRSAA